MKTEITLLSDKTECSGCGACLVSCPKSAIEMKEDEYGYKYPVINRNLCVGCGKCLATCSYRKDFVGEAPIEVYAACSKEKAVERKSASGGIFATVAKNFIAHGGYVAGAVADTEDKKIIVRHILSSDQKDVLRMQGSKYVQSDAWECYEDVIKGLEKGHRILFCGTPCQVDAMKTITGNPDNFFTMDLICHGVPSLSMYNYYIDVLAKTLCGKITEFRFRDKSCNKDFCAGIYLKRGSREKKYCLSAQYVSFYKYFLEGAIYRENCYSCPYAHARRKSDITIGDYWGIEKFHNKDISRISGAWSCVLINTKKGKEVFEAFGRESAYIINSKFEWVAETNQQLNHPSEHNEKREHVMSLYRECGYAGLEKEYRKKRGGELRYRWQLCKEIWRNRNQAAKSEKDTEA